MTAKQIFRKEARRRLRKVTDKAQYHCGHEGPFQEYLEAKDDYLDWLAMKFEKSFEDGKLNQQINSQKP